MVQIASVPSDLLGAVLLLLKLVIFNSMSVHGESVPNYRNNGQEYQDAALMAHTIGSGAMNIKYYFDMIGVACENRRPGFWRIIDEDYRKCLRSKRVGSGNLKYLPKGSFNKMCANWRSGEQCNRNFAKDLDECLGSRKGTDVLRFIVAYSSYTCRDVSDTEGNIGDHISKHHIAPGVFKCFPELQDRILNCVKQDKISVSQCSQLYTVQECYGQFYTTDCNDPPTVQYMRELFQALSRSLQCPQSPISIGYPGPDRYPFEGRINNHPRPRIPGEGWSTTPTPPPYEIIQPPSHRQHGWNSGIRSSTLRTPFEILQPEPHPPAHGDGWNSGIGRSSTIRPPFEILQPEPHPPAHEHGWTSEINRSLPPPLPTHQGWEQTPAQPLVSWYEDRYGTQRDGGWSPERYGTPLAGQHRFFRFQTEPGVNNYYDYGKLRGDGMYDVYEIQLKDNVNVNQERYGTVGTPTPGPIVITDDPEKLREIWDNNQFRKYKDDHQFKFQTPVPPYTIRYLGSSTTGAPTEEEFVLTPTSTPRPARPRNRNRERQRQKDKISTFTLPPFTRENERVIYISQSPSRDGRSKDRRLRSDTKAVSKLRKSTTPSISSSSSEDYPSSTNPPDGPTPRIVKKIRVRKRKGLTTTSTESSTELQ